MGVYIKGMEMPRSCWECEVGQASQLDNKTCPFYAMEGQEQENYQNKIAEGCPISHVPPHGRLIDASEAYDKIAESAGEGSGNYVDMDVVGRGLDDTPTIIEAEEET